MLVVGWSVAALAIAQASLGLATAVRYSPQRAEAAIDRRAAGEYVNMAYFAWWTKDRYPASKLPAGDLTHVAYSFAQVDPSDGRVYPQDPSSDVKDIYDGDDASEAGNNAYGHVKQLYKLKKQNRHFKVLLAIGGWPQPSHADDFPKMAADPVKRKNFAKTAVEMMRDYGFDGIDIDWEYPQGPEPGQSEPNQVPDFIAMLQDLRRELDAYGSTHNNHHFLLTAAMGGSWWWYRHVKDYGKQLNEVLDRLHVMAYDYAAGDPGEVVHNANLLRPQGSWDDYAAVESAITAYVGAGVAPDKLVLGMPLYGRTFQNTTGLAGPTNTHMKNQQNAAEGSYEAGTYVYAALPRNGLPVQVDAAQVGAYTHDAATGEFVTFESPETLSTKVEWAKGKKLGGTFFWEAAGDKTGEGSLIARSRRELGTLEASENWLSYPDSQYENIARNLEAAPVSSTVLNSMSKPPRALTSLTLSSSSESTTTTTTSSSIPASTSEPSSTAAESTSEPSSSIPESTLEEPSSSIPALTSKPSSIAAESTSEPSSSIPASTSKPSSSIPESTLEEPSSSIPALTSEPSSIAAESTLEPSSSIPASTSKPSSIVAESTLEPSNIAAAESTSEPSSIVAESTSEPSSIVATSAFKPASIKPTSLVATSKPESLASRPATSLPLRIPTSRVPLSNSTTTMPSSTVPTEDASSTSQLKTGNEDSSSAPIDPAVTPAAKPFDPKDESASTSIVESTTVITITQCPPSVIDCKDVVTKTSVVPAETRLVEPQATAIRGVVIKVLVVNLRVIVVCSRGGMCQCPRGLLCRVQEGEAGDDFTHQGANSGLDGTGVKPGVEGAVSGPESGSGDAPSSGDDGSKPHGTLNSGTQDSSPHGTSGSEDDDSKPHGALNSGTQDSSPSGSRDDDSIPNSTPGSADRGSSPLGTPASTNNPLSPQSNPDSTPNNVSGGNKPTPPGIRIAIHGQGNSPQSSSPHDADTPTSANQRGPASQAPSAAPGVKPQCPTSHGASSANHDDSSPQASSALGKPLDDAVDSSLQHDDVDSSPLPQDDNVPSSLQQHDDDNLPSSLQHDDDNLPSSIESQPPTPASAADLKDSPSDLSAASSPDADSHSAPLSASARQRVTVIQSVRLRLAKTAQNATTLPNKPAPPCLGPECVAAGGRVATTPLLLGGAAKQPLGAYFAFALGAVIMAL
ncbi:hypothetical protein CDD81_6648 [Ophiocordyceps australis]|uniref:chitinase n=1 Tax=Ophiocordyceps australis TaxID=1399860 RepID=A0A2C5XHI8_9HYPO|nr:hypothetical protein CDD81_6648 [Ophiocordyceps australis]